MGVITAEWRKLWLPGLWLAAAVTTGCSWLLAAMMSGPRGAEQTLQLVPRFAALGLILLGVMAATGEYAGRQVLTTCAAMPCRAQVGVAKLATAAGALLTAALVTVLGLWLLAGAGEWRLPGAAAYLVAMGLLGYAVGLVLRQLVLALSTALVFLVVLPPMLLPYTRLASWLPGAAGADLFAASPEHPVMQSAAALAGWVALLWLTALVTWVRRDA